MNARGKKHVKSLSRHVPYKIARGAEKRPKPLSRHIPRFNARVAKRTHDFFKAADSLHERAWG